MQAQSAASPDVRPVTCEQCVDLTPRLFAVDHAHGETLDPRVRVLLDPVETGQCYYCALGRERATELHYHDRDEYWAWVLGRTRITLRLPDGRSDSFEIGPGWIIYCVRGVEHGHTPTDDWACYEWLSIRRPGARDGHLTRDL